jgi:hypothetical protein
MAAAVKVHLLQQQVAAAAAAQACATSNSTARSSSNSSSMPTVLKQHQLRSPAQAGHPWKAAHHYHQPLLSGSRSMAWVFSLS